jgi:glycosyltransferase involved in cell wall biosynthesis
MDSPFCKLAVCFAKSKFVESSIGRDLMPQLTSRKNASSPPLPRVGVILCYYNGSLFIDDQINSILQQTGVLTKVYVFDDLSNKNEIEYVENIAKENKLVVVNNSSGRSYGATLNFCQALTKIRMDCDYYAFSDQDDIWQQNKLARAIKAHEKFDDDKPALYCSRTEIVSKCGKISLGMSPLHNNTPSFQNALVQNIAGGNTMLFNKNALKSLRKTISHNEVVAHDWWVYLYLSGIGANIVYDPMPSVKYRQHDNNVVGSNLSFRARMKRIIMMLNGYLKAWNDIHFLALSPFEHHLETKNRESLGLYKKIRTDSFMNRISFLLRSGVYRQTMIGNLGLFIAVILRKV